MNWYKTKTIFIVCFLLLDLFLGYKIYDNSKENTISDAISDDNVQGSELKVTATTPVTPESVNFLKGTQMEFVDDKGELSQEIQEMEKSKPQKIEPFNSGTEIRGTFKNPIPVPKNEAERKKLLNTYIYKGIEYEYWKKDSKSNTLLFVQTFQNKPVFIQNNDLNMLTFHIKDNQIVSYQQSYFKFDKIDNTINIISAETAISNLQDKSSDLMIGPHSTISKIRLGYFNLVGDINQLIFMPVWELTVKTSGGDSKLRKFFIDASSGEIQTIDETGGEPQT